MNIRALEHSLCTKESSFDDIDTLDGLRVCFTGKLDLIRTHAEHAARLEGAIICNYVTKKLDILVVGCSNTITTKQRKAKEQGIVTINERRFIDLVSNQLPI